jgi:hypothetical protein
MFLDLAYMIRAQLKRMGYERPEVVGVFFLPPADVTRTRAMALGNTYAALKELEYFSKPGVTFKAQYHEHDPVIEDGDAPFQRCALLPLAAEGDDPAKQKLVEVTSQVLFRELCSPMGRKLDELRSSSASRHGEAGPRLQSFGLYNLVWPRRTLLQQAARRICHALVTRWLSKDSKPIREQVREWVQERWQQQEMAADHFIMRLRQLAEDFLGASADTAFLNALGPMVQRFTPPVPTNPRQKQAPMPELHPEEVRYGFEQLLQLVGKSEDDNTADQPAKLVAVLREGADKLGSEWEQKLAMMPVSLIETPALRLAGAEEAIRQVTAMIEQVLEHHEPLAKELTARAAEAYDWLETFTNPKPGGRRSALQTRDVLALLRSYAKWRFQSVVLQQLAHVFLRLRGHLSDDLREVNFCRVRLTELQHLFESPPEAVAASEEATLSQAGRCLFPSGCTTLDDALGQYLTCLSPEAYLEADGKIEQAIKREYKALVHICLTPANILKKVETLMLETATEFAGAYLAEVEVTDMYLSQFSDNDADLANDLARCFAEAVPPLAPDGEDPAAGFHVLAAPGGPTADQLRDFLREALPGTKVHTADSDDDIVMYRECPILSLADLEQYGPVGRDAYCLMKATDNFTPHTRIDLPFE